MIRHLHTEVRSRFEVHLSSKVNLEDLEVHVVRQLKLLKFRDLSIDDPFFDSLKTGYDEFPEWFAKKANEDLYAVIDDQTSILSGMLYLKLESGPVRDVMPHLPNRVWLKVGTLKVVGKGTKLGERILKKMFDVALAWGAEAIYVTVFEAHARLVALFKEYGFTKAGTKTTKNGTEDVLVRSLTTFTGDRLKDYPFIHTSGKQAWLLAIYPNFHTRFLPDSILRHEPTEMVQDVSHTNSIQKVYIAKIALNRMKPGDIVVFYRTNDGKGKAFFRSVVTSIGVIEEVRSKKDFVNFAAFLAYTKPRSVFSEEELRTKWDDSKRLYVAKMTYNVAFGKRTTRGRLIEDGIVSEQPRWDLRPLTSDQLQRILKLGEVNARIAVD